MTLAAKLLTVALALPAPWYPPERPPETGLERALRIQRLTEALVLEAKNPPACWRWSTADLAWAGLVITWWESGRWRVEVHDGTRRGDAGRSVCLAQIHDGGEELVGTDLASTRRCIRTAYEHLARHARRCLPKDAEPSPWHMAAVFTGFGTGHSCDPAHDSPHLGSNWALERARQWWRLKTSWSTAPLVTDRQLGTSPAEPGKPGAARSG